MLAAAIIAAGAVGILSVILSWGSDGTHLWDPAAYSDDHSGIFGGMPLIAALLSIGVLMAGILTFAGKRKRVAHVVAVFGVVVLIALLVYAVFAEADSLSAGWYIALIAGIAMIILGITLYFTEQKMKTTNKEG